MITRIQLSTTVAASPAALFARVTDYSNVPAFIEGLQQLRPAGQATTGTGALFDAVMKIGPSTFHSKVEITEYETDRRVTWSASGGQAQAVTFDLDPIATGTRVVVEVRYERPGGIAGSLLAPVIEQAVRVRARNALGRLEQQV
jgi:carbon monoxide dehydrogenase subunit G